ncbi:MAG: FAD-dependent oxidoreductase [Nannocystaceae bacterium]|nr:FAD-dependent oxidoreductase [Nannocystaceae bacterium]
MTSGEHTQSSGDVSRAPAARRIASADPVVVIGAGLTGLSTALHLPQDRAVVLLERDDRVGGKARTARHEGFTFDVTGHWLHLRDDRVKALVSDLFEPGDLVEIERRTGIYTHGTMLPYPFQANLHGLPLSIVRECLVGFVEAQVAAANPDALAPKTFADFAVARFGRGIAEHFFVPYNTKLWGTSPDALTADWVQRFVPVPDVAQVIGGALGLVQEGLGYNARFLYPKAGGIDALPNAMGARLAVARPDALKLRQQFTRVDARNRQVLVGETWQPYSKLVSTVPLPRLIARIDGAPPEVVAAAKSLRAVGWRWLDVATKTPSPLDEHWVYVPEMDIPFFRVGIYSNALPAMAPPGCGSLYVELSDRDTPPDLPTIFKHLAAMGAITRPEDVLFARMREVRCAYVMFDHAYAEATATIHAWLATQDILSTGRYGAWIYNSMEDSILLGMDAADWAA